MKKLVIDIGGTAIKYAIMDMDATIHEKGELDTPTDTLEHLLDVITSLYYKFKDKVDGIALSMPGNIDSDTGEIYTPGALTYNANVNIIKAIQERVNVNVAVENDGKSAALAELWKGNLSGCKDGIVLIIGTGIGGGIIHQRKLIKGKHFFAGEVSYLMTDLNSQGMENVFALKGSTTALILQVAALKGIEPSTLDGNKIFEWIHEGDKDSMAALENIANNIAVQIYNLQCLFDPEKVCIGGGISKQKILIEKIKEKLNSMYEKIPFPIPHAIVENCAYYNDSNLIGALYNYKIHYEC